MGTGDHRCEWRARVEKLEQDLAYAAKAVDRAEKIIATQAEALQLKDELLAKQGEQITQIQGTVEKLQRHVFGKRSEKITPLEEALRDPARAEADRVAALQTRRENAEKKRRLVARRIEHKVREDQKVCPKCGGHDFAPLGDGLMTELYELIPAVVERQLHVQEKLRCRCGETILTADGPTKVFDKARVGPNFMAQVAVSKCADALPLHRQAKAYRRVGVQVNDSTLGDYFHRTAEIRRQVCDRWAASRCSRPRRGRWAVLHYSAGASQAAEDPSAVPSDPVRHSGGGPRWDLSRSGPARSLRGAAITALAGASHEGKDAIHQSSSTGKREPDIGLGLHGQRLVPNLDLQNVQVL